MLEDSHSPMKAPAPFRGGAVFDFVNAKPMARNDAQNGYLATAGAALEDVLDPVENLALFNNPIFKGKTVQEIITIQHAIKAMTGDLAAITSWQDRIMGKPKQAIEAVSVGLSFTEYLNMVATGNLSDDNPPAIELTPEETRRQTLLEEV